MSVSNGVYVTRSPHVLRAEAELESEVVGRLSAGARVCVLDRKALGDGKVRWKLGTAWGGKLGRADRLDGLQPVGMMLGGSPPNLLRLGVACSGAGLTMQLKHVKRLNGSEDDGDEMEKNQVVQALRTQMREARLKAVAERQKKRELIAHAKADEVRDLLKEIREVRQRQIVERMQFNASVVRDSPREGKGGPPPGGAAANTNADAPQTAAPAARSRATAAGRSRTPPVNRGRAAVAVPSDAHASGGPSTHAAQNADFSSDGSAHAGQSTQHAGQQRAELSSPREEAANDE